MRKMVKTNNTKEIKKEIRKEVRKADVDQALLDNFINLQRVLTNLSIKFDDLSNNISKLLQLFEISAKSFTENYPATESGVDSAFLKKLDSLLEQNKTISKGILLMEERIRNKSVRDNESSINQMNQGDDDSRMNGMYRSRPLPKY